MRTLLICHEDEPLNRAVLPRWLASFSTLAGIIVLRESRAQKWRRIKREIRRVGLLRFLDVLAFRAYYAAFLARQDGAWEKKQVERLCQRYPEVPASTPILLTNSPNTEEARSFACSHGPDLMLARCKFILKRAVFEIPRDGTFVMHPGICPEYRNSHGCFWALAYRDLERVGMTLLRVDLGVDTGQVFGFYRCEYDESVQSHIVIQHRTVFDNLDRLQDQLLAIHEGHANPIDVTGRKSAVWGQPWLTRYFRWKLAAQNR
jgi:hypothetical protein